jgi:L-rhamnose isomerase/sugar isomerase
VFIEHKLFEPAFYATTIADWGTSFACAQTLGPKAKCLVDLGHHAPNTNIEMIVARLAQFGKLGGFHFNDSKYGDDDLDSGDQSVPAVPGLQRAGRCGARDGAAFKPAYMLDQSHNVTDPIESLMSSAVEVQRAFVQAALVDRAALASSGGQRRAAIGAGAEARFRTDVSADPGDGARAFRRRRRSGGVLPRQRLPRPRRGSARPAKAGASSSGIV